MNLSRTLYVNKKYIIQRFMPLKSPFWDCCLVEAAGIEPASVSPRPSALHAYSVYYLTPHWPNEKGLRGELALSLIASATSRARQRSHESRTRFEYMGISAPG